LFILVIMSLKYTYCFVLFNSPDVSAVLEKGSITLKNQEVTIECPVPPSEEEDTDQAVEEETKTFKVILKDLPPSVDFDEIEMYLQSKKRVGDIWVQNIEYEEHATTAVVTLGDQECMYLH